MGRVVFQMITLDHEGEGGGVQKGLKTDYDILEQPLITNVIFID